jgi:hypothetical protein
MPPRRRSAVTFNFFPQGDDLPLFSGAPVRHNDRPFRPEDAPAQPAFFDLRPDPFHTLGGVISAPSPTEEVTDDKSEPSVLSVHVQAGCGEGD